MQSTTLLKALTEAGIGSRRKLADAIKHGRVKVNGQIVENFRHPLNLRKDAVSVDEIQVNLMQEKHVYLMLNKPKDCVSTTSDERGRNTVLDILPPEYRHLRLYPVGRLDKDSTGLLLLTNDGNLTYQLTHPKFEHEKEYLVQLEGKLKPDDKLKIEKGIKLEEYTASPAVIREITQHPPFNYSLTIHEGRKRQVRLMFGSMGYHVLALKRIRTGNLHLGDLPEGSFRELTSKEIKDLSSQQAK